MYTIKENNSYELEIKKSNFISKVYKVKNIGEVNNILLNLKKEYNDATHICYAYVVNDYKKSSDDGEPGGTAGVPIMQVLEKNNLNYILAIVIRYFGGIKLGAGGLVRAYTKSISDLLKSSAIIKLIPGYNVEISVSYDEQKKLDYILRNYNFEKRYENNVSYTISIPQEDLSILKNYNIKILNEIEIEKESF